MISIPRVDSFCLARLQEAMGTSLFVPPFLETQRVERGRLKDFMREGDTRWDRGGEKTTDHQQNKQTEGNLVIENSKNPSKL